MRKIKYATIKDFNYDELVTEFEDLCKLSTGFAFQQGEFDEWLIKEKGLNYCDRCNDIYKSEDLVWITADDFEPKKGEYVTVEMYKKYDALCEHCYHELSEKHEEVKNEN